MTNAARKVAIAIIVVLIGSIGYVWYGNYKTSNANPAGALVKLPSPTPVNTNPYYYNQNYIKELVQSKFTKAEEMKTLDPASYQGIYKTTDLLTSANTNEAALRSYGLQILRVLKPLSQERKNEIELTIKALNDKDQAAVQKIVAAKDVDNEMIRGLLDIRAPKTAATVHLKLINALYADSVLLDNMSGVMDDPYFALTSASAYLTSHTNLFKTLEELNKYFLTSGLRFDDQTNMQIFVNL